MKKILLLLFLPLIMGFGKKEKMVIFLAGDSTMADKKAEEAPETGWGTVLATLFDNTQLLVDNHAVNGRSSKSFRDLGHWVHMMTKVKPGDYVFIQFGHNDQKVEDPTRYAPAQTEYRSNLIRFIAEVRAKGAQPVLLTPVVRRNFDTNGQLVDKHGEYPDVVRQVAVSEQVVLIDLWAKSKKLLECTGPEGSKDLYLHLSPGVYPSAPNGKQDNTHFSPWGAANMAALVAAGIQESTLPLREMLKKSLFPEKMAYELPLITVPVFKKDTFFIQQFGAISGGVSLNTHAIQTAIDSCSAKGGGVVVVPSGLWLTGPLRLLNNVNLHVEAGALLQFSDNFDDYPLVQTNWEGLDAIRVQSPFSASDAQNIAITGTGVIDGSGIAWRPVKKSKVTQADWKRVNSRGGVLDAAGETWYPTQRALTGAGRVRPGVIAEGYDEAKAEEIKEFLRPNMLSLIRCKKILLDGPTFQNSPAWTLHLLLCEQATVKNVTVKNPEFAQNGDGIDIESTRFFHIKDCVFDTGDDGICLKSGRNEEGRRRGKPTADGIVQGCTVYRAHGGFVIGSEMSGGVRNIYVSDCTFLGSDIGLRFKTTRGRGGSVEDIYISDIRMTDIPSEAILFDMYYNGKAADEAIKNPDLVNTPVTDGTPVFRRFFIRNVACRGAKHAVYIQGLPEMNVQDVHISDCTFHSQQGITLVESKQLFLDNILLETTTSDAALTVLNSRDISLNEVKIRGKALKSLQTAGKKNGVLRIRGGNVAALGIDRGTDTPAQNLIIE